MQVTFRPLPVWPHKPTANRPRSAFATSYPKTLALLEREVGFLGGRDVVMGVGLSEYDIRKDGQPRANARSYGHPGVEISFNSREHGRLTYATDQYWDWQDNVRAIALSLERSSAGACRRAASTPASRSSPPGRARRSAAASWSSGTAP
jgi:hypothetical protein